MDEGLEKPRMRARLSCMDLDDLVLNFIGFVKMWFWLKKKKKNHPCFLSIDRGKAGEVVPRVLSKHSTFTGHFFQSYVS